MDSNSDRTVKLLQSLSYHLSGRSNCRHVEYEVSISSDSIDMDPKYFVFPSRYERKQKDSEYVVNHVMVHHFSGYSPSDFVPGKYVYRLSVDNRRRKWVRVF